MNVYFQVVHPTSLGNECLVSNFMPSVGAEWNFFVVLKDSSIAKKIFTLNSLNIEIILVDLIIIRRSGIGNSFVELDFYFCPLLKSAKVSIILNIIRLKFFQKNLRVIVGYDILLLNFPHCIRSLKFLLRIIFTCSWTKKNLRYLCLFANF